MADIQDKDYKATLLKMLRELKGDMEKVKKTRCKQNENINKAIERDEKEILELKHTIIEMKTH